MYLMKGNTVVKYVGIFSTSCLISSIYASYLFMW